MQKSHFTLLPAVPPGRAAILLIVVVQLLLFCAPACGLYEDQIGKFDWKRSQIGAVRFAAFHGVSGERIIAATEHNVLAALNTKTGDIAWRKLLEKNERGSINFLHVTRSADLAINLPNKYALPTDLTYDEEEDADLVITISGTAPALVRGWHAQTGHAQFEWTLTPTTNQATDGNGGNGSSAVQQLWLYDERNFQLHHIVPVWGSHLELTAYAVRTGQPIRPTTRRITTPWLQEKDCALTKRQFVCLVAKKEVIYIDLTSENHDLSKFSSFGAGPEARGGFQVLPGTERMVLVDNGLVDLRQMNPIEIRPVELVAGVSYYADNGNAHSVRLVQAIVRGDDSTRKLHINIYCPQNGESSTDFEVQLDHTQHANDVQIVDVLCKRKSGQTPFCRVLLTTSDAALLLLQQGRTKWTREEALADVVAVEMIDLQLSDAEGSIESELKNKDGDILGALARRLTGQIAHLRNSALTALGLGAQPSDKQRAGLVRDAFGLHKMLVVLTARGKMFGIDNQSGKLHWTRVLDGFVGFAGGQEPMQLLVQRSGGHFPLSAQCTVLARDAKTGNGLLYQFDPITGLPIRGTGIVRLPYAVRQAAVVAHVRDEDFVRALVLLDHSNGAHVVPADAVAQADGLYVFVAVPNSGVISGVQVRATADGNGLRTQQIWEVNVAGGEGAAAHQIVRVASKNHAEHVHSQGRVFNDRSVLYKYINPNLVAVATIGPDPVHKSVLNIHLLDVVSGGIVYSMSHRRVRQPLHIVHSENWLVYTYYNEKVRRTECTTVELYEGKTQSNGTVWSSLNAPQLPMVERQSYVLPAQVVALRETITERGITNKHVLVALSTGSVVEMPWALLDPRRPVLQPNQAREEGIIPYIPELQLPSENVINYNQSVANVRGIAVAPSGLESTCLVMAYGLDIFVTRVAPSKTFDLLKEDFDYMLIMIVLIGLSTASVVVKQLSARKAVKQAWK